MVNTGKPSKFQRKHSYRYAVLGESPNLVDKTRKTGTVDLLENSDRTKWFTKSFAIKACDQACDHACDCKYVTCNDHNIYVKIRAKANKNGEHKWSLPARMARPNEQSMIWQVQKNQHWNIQIDHHIREI